MHEVALIEASTMRTKLGITDFEAGKAVLHSGLAGGPYRLNIGLYGEMETVERLAAAPTVMPPYDDAVFGELIPMTETLNPFTSTIVGAGWSRRASAAEQLVGATGPWRVVDPDALLRRPLVGIIERFVVGVWRVTNISDTRGGKRWLELVDLPETDPVAARYRGGRLPNGHGLKLLKQG